MKKLCSTLAFVLLAGAVQAAPAPDSRRLALAKDYIADEQWARAIAELVAVADDARDANRDEALFWLAHSQSQLGDHADALQTISRLERLYVKSRWVRPARSLRVDIAQRLRRDDVLWVLAAPPPLPTPSPAAAPYPPAQPAPRGAAPTPLPPRPTSPPALPRIAPPPQPVPAPESAPVLPPPTPMAPGAAPMPSAMPRVPHAVRPGFPAPFEGLLPAQPYEGDADLRMQALVGLLDSHSERVIPLLREMALDRKDPSEARRAVFVLAQSPRVEARNTVVEAARRGQYSVRLAAIREMGRVQVPVYTTALVGIARNETDASVRDTAIVTLGRSGARVQLRTLYTEVPGQVRFAVLSGLFNAKDDDELIRIATNERDLRLRTRARQHLRLLATPKAVKFLTENP